ncbi:MAG TPA: hypothetical protein VK196_00175 [Magnetospirillum sp.]|nr:hypothetical protein [Magnetospirillum sp.]
MSIISELPVHLDESKVSLEDDAGSVLTACMDCEGAATCRIAAGLARLARLRERMAPHDDNLWLRGRIDEYLGVQVCLAGVFGLSAPTEAAKAPPSASHPDTPKAGVLELALRRRAAGAGPTGLDHPKPGDRVPHFSPSRPAPPLGKG